MPKRATGNVRKNAQGYSARVRIGPNKRDRPSFALAVRSDEAAEARAALLADLAKRLRGQVASDEIKMILEAVGGAQNGQGARGAHPRAGRNHRGRAAENLGRLGAGLP